MRDAGAVRDLCSDALGSQLPSRCYRFWRLLLSVGFAGALSPGPLGTASSREDCISNSDVVTGNASFRKSFSYTGTSNPGSTFITSNRNLRSRNTSSVPSALSLYWLSNTINRCGVNLTTISSNARTPICGEAGAYSARDSRLSSRKILPNS